MSGLPRGAIAEFETRYVRPREGRACVVGSRLYKKRPDRRALYPEALGVDMLAGEGVDRVLDLEQPLPADLVAGFGHVDCLSVLEHARRPWLLASNLEQILVRGGTIFVTVPFVWRIHSYPSDYWRLSPEGLRALFPQIAWVRVAFAHWDLMEESEKLPAVRVHGKKYFMQTEVCGFGMKQ